MADWKDKLAGGATAPTATVVPVGTAVATVLVARNRVVYGLYVGAPMFLGFGASAIASQSWPLPSGAYWEDKNWNGHVTAVAPGGSAPLFVREVA